MIASVDLQSEWPIEVRTTKNQRFQKKFFDVFKGRAFFTGPPEGFALFDFVMLVNGLAIAAKFGMKRR